MAGVEIKKSMYDYAKGVEEELKALRTPRQVERYLDYILEIRREQWYNSDTGKWETIKYILVRTVGGPNVYIDTDGYIYAFWGAEKVEYPIVDDNALRGLKNIENHLFELFGD